MAPEDHAGDKAPARRNSANGANLMIDLEYLKRKQSACACEEDVEDFARRLVEDVRIEGVPLIPAVDANEFSFNLLSYLGRVAISEQSLEVSGDLSESGDEEIPSGLGSMVSHKSFPLNDEKHAGKFFSIVPVGEEEPPTCFPEEGEETPSMSECFCQANLRAFAERVETPESSTKSDEAELTPKRIVSDEDDTISDKQRHKVSFGSAAPRQDFRSNALCDQYDSVNVIADKFVGWVLKAAVSALSWSDKQEAEEEEGEEEEEEGEGDIGEIHFKGAVCSLVTFVESYNFSWPTIRDFTPQIGMNAIREYIGTWYYTENWTYDIKLVLRQSDECSDYFTFETRWGIPTKQYPIPQVTASIFFVVDVSRVKPVDCLVDITYYFEGCSYMQEPFVNFFDEKQLFDIVNAKLKFYKQLKF